MHWLIELRVSIICISGVHSDWYSLLYTFIFSIRLLSLINFIYLRFSYQLNYQQNKIIAVALVNLILWFKVQQILSCISLCIIQQQLVQMHNTLSLYTTEQAVRRRLIFFPPGGAAVSNLCAYKERNLSQFP